MLVSRSKAQRSLTKNPHPPTKIFFQVLTRRLANP